MIKRDLISLALVAVISVGTAACPDESNNRSSGGGGGDSGSAVNFATIVSVVCDFMIRCEGTTGPLFVDKNACTSMYTQQYSTCPAAGELMTVNSARAAEFNACVVEIRSLTCPNDIDFDRVFSVPPCSLIWDPDPIVGAAASCAAADCDVGFRCATVGDPTTNCPVCEALPGLNDACPDYVCGPGLGCNAGTCEALGTLGSTCDYYGTICEPELFCDYYTSLCAEPLPDGSACTGRTNCISGRCDYATDLCDVGAAVGEACLLDRDCAGGFRICAGSLCAERASLGSTCTRNEDCALPGLCTDSVCTSFDYCAAKSVGESCVGGDCVADAYCPFDYSGAPQVCTSKAAIGSACQSYYQYYDGDPPCVDGAFCDYYNGECMAKVTTGGTCPGYYSSGNSCASADDYCDYYTSECTTKKATGESCNSTIDCAGAGAFCDYNASVCAMPQTGGGTCYINSHCLSDRCVGNICAASASTCTML